MQSAALSAIFEIAVHLATKTRDALMNTSYRASARILGRDGEGPRAVTRRPEARHLATQANKGSQARESLAEPGASTGRAIYSNLCSSSGTSKPHLRASASQRLAFSSKSD